MACVAAIAGASAGRPAGSDGGDEAFAFLRPWVTISRDDIERVDEGDVLVRTLPGADGQLAVIGVARLQAPPDRLVAWTRAIADLKRGPFVLAIGRFSDPPTLADFDALRLDDEDLDAIRTCRPGRCGLKLGMDEIDALQRAVDEEDADWQEAIQREFRRVVLQRLDRYRAHGSAGLPPYVDMDEPVHPQEAFDAIMASSPYLPQHVPDLAADLEGYPRVQSPQAESFFYWSKEAFNAGKPVVSVTHVTIARPADGAGPPAVIVAGKQIFASHYMNSSLGLTMVMQGAAPEARYLVYLNRSQLDLLGGVFGFLKRSVLEARIRRDTPRILRGLRDRLESGDPPGASGLVVATSTDTRGRSCQAGAASTGG